MRSTFCGQELPFAKPRTRRNEKKPLPQGGEVHGYYALPFLFGDTLVARVDLKADCATNMLLVQRVHWEPGAPPEAKPALDRHLADMASWLELDTVAG